MLKKEVVVEKPEPVAPVQPVAEVKPPTQKEESNPVETPVKETIPPVAESKPATESSPATPETNDSELIEARGEQLRGLRVIGKIELPSDRAKKKIQLRQVIRQPTKNVAVSVSEFVMM